MTCSSSPWGAIPQTGTGNADGYMFFNTAEARTLDAMTARIMPSEPDGRGAREAGVVTYLDHAVAGYFRDLQSIYRVGLQRLDAYQRGRRSERRRSRYRRTGCVFAREHASDAAIGHQRQRSGRQALHDPLLWLVQRRRPRVHQFLHGPTSRRACGRRLYLRADPRQRSGCALGFADHQLSRRYPAAGGFAQHAPGNA